MLKRIKLDQPNNLSAKSFEESALGVMRIVHVQIPTIQGKLKSSELLR